MPKFWPQFGKSFHLITMWMRQFWVGQCCHHSSELGSNTFLRGPSIPQNDDSIDWYILPRTTAFPQYGIAFFLDTFSIKNACVNQKSSRFSLDNNVNTVGLDRKYICEEYLTRWPTFIIETFWKFRFLKCYLISKMCPFFVGTLHNFRRSDLILSKNDDLQ